MAQLNINKKGETRHYTIKTYFTLQDAIHTRALWIQILLFLSFNICVQLVMVHLVNYATDLGITSFIAATIVSVIGIGSIVGRLTMGIVADRIGNKKALIISCSLLLASLILLMFSRELWMLYLFAVFFSFSYGGDVTLIPLLISQFFGLTSMMTLTGVISTGTRLGGALGAWIGGSVFDMTHSYIIAFGISIMAGIFMLLIACFLVKSRDTLDQTSYK
jgi:MFS family permease